MTRPNGIGNGSSQNYHATVHNSASPMASSLVLTGLSDAALERLTEVIVAAGCGNSGFNDPLMAGIAEAVQKAWNNIPRR